MGRKVHLVQQDAEHEGQYVTMRQKLTIEGESDPSGALLYTTMLYHLLYWLLDQLYTHTCTPGCSLVRHIHSRKEGSNLLIV